MQNNAQALAQLLEIEAIKQLKYQYLRHVDLKEWDAVAALFTADVVSAYADGKYSYQGREAVVECAHVNLDEGVIITEQELGKSLG